MKILIVEDDKEIQNLLTYFFKKEGFSVESAENGIEALKILKVNKPNCIILDLMLPGIDGKNLTKIVREMPEDYGEPAILMLTAKTDIDDVLEGLTIGADDYMKKPFDPREVILRVKKLVSSREKESKKNIKESKNIDVYEIEDLKIDLQKRSVLYIGEEVDLSKKEYDLLLLFFKNSGIVLTREKILDYVWGTDYFSGDRSVDVYISKLREKLPVLAKYIKTMKGVGYKLEEKR